MSQENVELVRRADEAYRRETLLDDAQAEIDELIDAGDTVVVGSTLRGRGKQSGAEAKFTFWQTWTIQNGKFARGQGFARREEALEAAGLREWPGSGFWVVRRVRPLG